MLVGFENYHAEIHWLGNVQHANKEDARYHDLLSNSELQSPDHRDWDEKDQYVNDNIGSGVSDIVVIKVVSIMAALWIVG
jgi:hypothetical protein